MTLPVDDLATFCINVYTSGATAVRVPTVVKADGSPFTTTEAFSDVVAAPAVDLSLMPDIVIVICVEENPDVCTVANNVGVAMASRRYTLASVAAVPKLVPEMTSVVAELSMALTVVVMTGLACGATMFAT